MNDNKEKELKMSSVWQKKEEISFFWLKKPLTIREVIVILCLLVVSILCIYSTTKAQTCAIDTYNNVAEFYKTHCVCNIGTEQQNTAVIDPATLEALSRMH